MDIYLVRHTRVEVGQEICYGSTNVSLANNYLEDFEKIKLQLGNIENYKVYSSSLSRTKLLAQYISDGNYIPDPRHNELDFGKWEMIPWEQIPAKDLKKWMSDFENIKCPEGESFNDLYQRTTDFFKEVINNNQNIIIITHSSPIKAILSFILGIPLRNSISIDIEYGSISRIERKYNQLIVKEINV